MRVLIVVPSVGLVLGLAGWIAPASTPPRPRIAAVREAPAPRHASLDLLDLGRIVSYPERATAPRLLERSPFAFAPRAEHSASASVHRTAAPARPAVESVAVIAERLPVLAGIVEEDTRGGIVRTAVFSGEDGVVRFAMVGESVGSVFRISAIDPDRVVLVNAITTARLELILK